MLLEDLLDVLKDDLDLPLGVDILILLQAIEVSNDLQGLLVISPETLLDTLNVIIRTPTGLPTLKQPLQHHLLTANQMQDEGHIHLLPHDLLPSIQVLQVTRESVNEEPSALEAMQLHGSLQQHDGDLTRDDLPLDYVLLDDLSELRPRLLPLGTQQVPSGEMDELEVVLDVLALSPLA